MAEIRVMILRAAGTNCDLECEHAWKRVGALPERVHVRRLIESPALLDRYQIVTIPGGFSYGDDISAGRVFAAQIERHLADELRAFASAGRLVLGICNGFQVLVKAGLLPELRSADEPTCTVTYNDPPGFQDRWVWLRAESARCVFLEPGRCYEMPIAHGEGRVVFRDATSMSRVIERDLCALRYVAPPSVEAPVLAIEAAAGRDAAASWTDEPAPPYNPNGSTADIAGLCDESGHVLGLMPHPDRYIDPLQHPSWTSQPPREHGDGLAIFQRAVEYLA